MLRNCLAILSLALITSNAVADEKGAEPEQPQMQTLSIGPASFGEYPAVLVSLQEGKVYKTDKGGDPPPEVKSPLDLFIEPRDPEIASYNGKGKRAELGFLAVDFDQVEQLPDGIEWSSRLPMQQSLLKAGFVFFVRSALENTYKVRIDALDSKAQTMKFSYAQLNPQPKEPITDKASLTPAVQAVALRAVTDFLLEFDADRATKHVAPLGTYRNNRQSSIKDLIQELSKLSQKNQQFPALQELGFFTQQDLPQVQEKLSAYRGADKMFEKSRIPANLKNGFGCYAVTYPLQAGEPAASVVLVMIFQKVGNETKIVYIDDN